MKKICVLMAAFLFVTAGLNAQTYYWIGSAGGSWSNGANWSLSQGGVAAGSFPQDDGDDAMFTANASVIISSNIIINRVSVTGASTVVNITGDASNPSITVKSSSAITPALNIDAGCRLEHDATADSWFQFIFDANAKGEVNGEWFFTGNFSNNAFASYNLGVDGNATAVNINNGGTIIIDTEGFIEPNETTGDEYLIFKAGATLKFLGDAPVIPVANYDANSIIEIDGVTMSSVLFEEQGSVGIINYNCPAQANGSNPLYLSLLGFEVKGDLNISNTNDNELTLIAYSSTVGLPSRDATIKGDLNIQGTSKVSIAQNDGPEIPNNLFIEGNLIANGTSLSIHTGPDVALQPTTVYVKGNIEHTSGIFIASSAVVNQTTGLYVIEMNGTVAQTINSHSGTFDNAQNQVTLRINNAAGVSLLSSLSVGRLSFNSANKGILSTGANVLTINNTTPASGSSIVVESPSATGYVNGTVRRKSASAEQFVMPVGAGGNYRPATLIPASSTSSTFEAKYINSGHGGALTAPVRVIAPYHWEILRIGAGADASVQLDIPGQLPGALTGYDISVARFNGTNWITAKGTNGIIVSPGTASSGTVRSDVQADFGFFTIALESESALPTYLITFDAKKYMKESADLRWKITQNSTPAFFEVMRAADGLNFKVIGKLSGLDEVRNYRFIDPLMLTGNNYYKLRMSDKDGSVTYSTIILLSHNRDGIQINSMMPTMVRDVARLSVSSSMKANMKIVITDISGRIMMSRTVGLIEGDQDVWINASAFAQGVFQVTCYVPGEKATTVKFIKL